MTLLLKMYFYLSKVEENLAHITFQTDFDLHRVNAKFQQRKFEKANSNEQAKTLAYNARHIV